MMPSNEMYSMIFIFRMFLLPLPGVFLLGFDGKQQLGLAAQMTEAVCGGGCSTRSLGKDECTLDNRLFVACE